MNRRPLESEKDAMPEAGPPSRTPSRHTAYEEILEAGRAIGQTLRRLALGDDKGNGKGDAGDRAKSRAEARARQRLADAIACGRTGRPVSVEQSEAGWLQGLPDKRAWPETRRVFASAFEQYLHAVEEMVGKTLRGANDMESLVALTGMLSSLSSAASRTGFAKVQRLLDQVYLRIVLLGSNPSAETGREIRLAILRDVFELRKLAGQMKHTPD
jgi:hypothetical protein